MRYRSFASAVLALSAAAAVLAQSNTTKQSSSAEPQQPPTFRSEANFIRVDVYPTKGGKPVQDLSREDFEVLEDGVPQTVQSFEHVLVSPAGPEAQRSEPSTIEQSRQLVANPKNRVFVLFLDTPHVSVTGGWHAREPLIRLIDRVLGPDDLVGVMTPGMSAGDVTFARKTEVIASGLRSRWPWGERGTIQQDEREKMYETCYPPLGGGVTSRTAAQMIARKRERATLDALTELVYSLRDMREERKAIVTVTEGWLLYRPDPGLTSLESGPGGTERIPGVDPISVGPDGRITTKNTKASSPYSKTDCDGDRMHLAMMDDAQYFRDLTYEANRANATFYTVDPRGLPVFDSSMGIASPSVNVDAQLLRARLDSLRSLAETTDGIAVLNNNDLDIGMKRISDDLSSYYLLGYYSTNGKLDGRFHEIKVRVKRPGIDVRARKGYRAATSAEVTAARAAAAAPVDEARAPVDAAIASLARIRDDDRLTLNAVTLGAAGQPSTVLVEGELPPGPASARPGGAVEITLSSAGTTASAQATLAAGDRSFVVPVAWPQGAPGAISVRARMGASAVSGLAGSITIVPGEGTQPMLFRRGPATGNRVVPAASFLFSRTERARFEFPSAPEEKPSAGRLLDKSGQPLAIPVTVSERTDAATGQHWIAADVTLAPLAAGDYAVEVTTTGTTPRRLVTALRVGR